MKTFIILLNFLLLTLILYNFINSKVVEYFSGCSGSSKNAVYRQQSKTDIMASQINKLKTQYNALNKQNITNRGNIGTNKSLIRSQVQKVKGGADKMEKELDNTEKDSGGDTDYSLSGSKSTANVHSGNPVNAKNFASGIRSSNSDSRS
tara:strand:- start:2122 stop:2568 length:447 start_codon:yes stop_codon:yes gene_type:complete